MDDHAPASAAIPLPAPSLRAHPSARRRLVLVTGTGGRSVGCGIVHALTRASGGEAATRWQIASADADPFAFGLYQTDQRFLLPRASEPYYLKRLKQICQTHGITAILPGTEAETMLLSRERAQLLPVEVIANSPDLMPLMADKRLLAARLAELGIDTPATAPAEEWLSFARQHGFPFVFKPATSTGGSRGVRIITEERQMRSLAAELGPDVHRHIVQEYVDGADSEFTVGVLTDRSGNLIDSIVLRRNLIGLSLLDSATHAGKTYALSTGYSQGFIEHNGPVQEACEDIALRLGSRGPLNIQLRVEGRRIVVFEIHPRFSGTTPIRADAGFNEPDILLRNFLNGETFGRLNYRSNLVAIRAFEHILVPITEYQSLRGNTANVA
jgi:carbamoyl-phosphate synthase large subunit